MEIMGDSRCDVCHQEDERDIGLYLKSAPPFIPWPHVWAHKECAEEQGFQVDWGLQRHDDS